MIGQRATIRGEILTVIAAEELSERRGLTRYQRGERILTVAGWVTHEGYQSPERKEVGSQWR